MLDAEQGLFRPLAKRDLAAPAPAVRQAQGFGGLAVGEGHQAMCEVLDYAPAMLPADRPRYLMGVGKPLDLVEAVARGVDMFD